MKCPFCGQEMENGKTVAVPGVGGSWRPDGWFWVSDYCVRRKGGIIFYPIKYALPPDKTMAFPTQLCMKCKKAVVSFSGE